MPEPTNRLKVAIIGYGTVGKAQTKEMRAKDHDDIYTVDIDPKAGADYIDIHNMVKIHGPMDVYIILVWTSEQVCDVLSNIPMDNHPLISIETTTKRGDWHDFRVIAKPEDADMILFPERIYPNDPYHGNFNQKRVMGGDWERGKQFYTRYMIPEYIVPSDNAEMVEISHALDNAYRFVTIAIAEDLCMLVGRDNFEELRRLCNSKWNIDILEAHNGVSSHCHDKDLPLFNNSYPDNKLFKMADKVNEEFKLWCMNE